MVINLDKTYGFSSKAIKELIEDLEYFDEAEKSGDIFLKLPSKPDSVSELAMVLIWMRMKSLMSSPCKKGFSYNEQEVDYFNERRFFDRLVGRKKTGFFRSKTVPLHFETFRLTHDEDETAKKISHAIDQNISKYSLSGEIKTHISELVNNAFHHSKSSNEVGCTSKMDEDNGFFTFCISDIGMGVRNSFVRNEALKGHHNTKSDSELLKEILKKDVTCNPQYAPQYKHSNSGIGLYYLSEFCKYHNGHLVVLSDKGYYYRDSNIERLKNFRLKIPGTTVYFRANISKEMSPEYRNLVNEFLQEYDERQFQFI